MKRRHILASHETISSSISRRKHRRKETKYIPPDVIEQILLRLPVKSVIRSRSVCKLWCAISSDASFATKHLSFANKDSSLDLVFPYWENTLSIYENGCHKCKIWTPIPVVHNKNGIIGSSINGLICLYGNENKKKKIIIFNPATRQSTALPYPSYRTILKHSPWRHLASTQETWNFGFNPNSNEYKIVHIYQARRKKIDGMNDNCCCRLAVFTLGKDTSSWRQIEGDAHVLLKSQAINIGATMYWQVYDHDYSALSILLFDLSEEKFMRIKAPEEEDWRSVKSFIMDLNGRLCWVWYSSSGQNKMMNLWTLDDKPLRNKAWTHLRAMKLSVLPGDIFGSSGVRLRYLPIRNKILIEVPNETRIQYPILYILDLTIKNNTVEYVLSVPDHANAGAVHLIITGRPYVESLIPVPPV